MRHDDLYDNPAVETQVPLGPPGPTKLQPIHAVDLEDQGCRVMLRYRHAAADDYRRRPKSREVRRRRGATVAVLVRHEIVR